MKNTRRKETAATPDEQPRKISEQVPEIHHGLYQSVKTDQWGRR